MKNKESGFLGILLTTTFVATLCIVSILLGVVIESKQKKSQTGKQTQTSSSEDLTISYPQPTQIAPSSSLPVIQTTTTIAFQEKPKTYTLTGGEGGFSVSVPVTIPYCTEIPAEESAEFCAQGHGTIHASNFLSGFDTGFRTLNDVGGGYASHSRTTMSIMVVQSDLGMSGQDFGEYMLKQNLKYSPDTTNSTGSYDNVGGSPAFSFVVYDGYREYGATLNVDNEKWILNKLDASEVNPYLMADAFSEPLPLRVTYFGHNDWLYRVIYPDGDKNAAQILRSWIFTK